MTDKPETLPSEGGSYTRDAKGNLVRTEAPTPEDGEKAPRKSNVKEG